MPRAIIDKYSDRITTISEGDLDRITQLSTSREVLGVFHKPVFEEPLTMKDSITLMLDNIQDPGNVGTIIRCADWFGVKQVICSNDTADVFSTKVIQSSMGSISRVRIVQGDLIAFLNEHRPVPVYASSLNGTDLSSINKINEGIIVIGNEAKGVNPSLLAMAARLITIPRKGSAESLNAAMAAAIILFHLT